MANYSNAANLADRNGCIQRYRSTSVDFSAFTAAEFITQGNARITALTPNSGTYQGAKVSSDLYAISIQKSKLLSFSMHGHQLRRKI